MLHIAQKGLRIKLPQCSTPRKECCWCVSAGPRLHGDPFSDHESFVHLRVFLPHQVFSPFSISVTLLFHKGFKSSSIGKQLATPTHTSPRVEVGQQVLEQAPSRKSWPGLGQQAREGLHSLWSSAHCSGASLATVSFPAASGDRLASPASLPAAAAELSNAYTKKGF